MKEACIGCLRHTYITHRASRKGKECEFVFTNGMDKCEVCKNEPTGSVIRKKCTHPLHISMERRSNKQSCAPSALRIYGAAIPFCSNNCF